MKKLTIAAVAVLMLLSASAFAFDTVSEKVRTQFAKNFTTAKNVEWKKTNEFYFATFTLNEHNLSVAYNEEGDMVGATRSIFLSDLPLNVSLAIKNKYEGYTLSDAVTELTYGEQTQYFLNAKNSKFTLQLKASSGGDISIEQKIKNK